MTGGGELPFNLHFENNESTYNVYLINGTDSILMESPVFRNDSIILDFPVYETSLHAKIIDERTLEGVYINFTKQSDNTIPFSAKAGLEYRFKVPDENNLTQNISGKYDVVFRAGEPDSSYAVGIFHQTGNSVNGTFMKTSGDYRYLSGSVINDSLFLSGFDGVFVHLFKCKISLSSITGTFYSGLTTKRSFVASRNDAAKLIDADAITSIRTDQEKFYFSFPDTDSVMVGLNDSRYQNKVIVVQILGSWCPNCLDESRFLAPYYLKYKEKGFEIIGLAFEKTDNFNRASGNVLRLKERLNIGYPILIASNRKEIRTTIPELDNFIAFPTTIILDKTHRVRKVHAGFSGPATGKPYFDYIEKFDNTIQELLNE
jgi:thiol-disulfide isomerase/thioredoxin